MISRRLFLALAGGAIFLPPSIRATENFPSLLDHIILGCNNLDTGISFVEQRTGVRALFGGGAPGSRDCQRFAFPLVNDTTSKSWLPIGTLDLSS